MSLPLAFLLGLSVGGAGAGVGAWLLVRRRNRQLGQFFSHAAHEINTPITAINITVLNLLGGVFGEVSADQVKWIDMMREQVGRLNGMVGELRDLIHFMLSRDLRLQSESVAPAELAQAALAAVQRGVAQGQFALESDLPADLPRVRVDRDRTVRTLTSLICHARKFRVDGDLRLSAARRADAVTLSLEYRGQPLPPGEPERSLELLYPAYGQKTHTLNAVGLGLGVLRAVARLQGGDLGLSVDTQGRTVLDLSLPVSPREEGGKTST